MKLKTILLILISLILANTAFAQKTKLPTAKKIIGNYIKAIGGKKAVQRQTSRYTKSTFEVSPIGIKGTQETWSVAPNKYYSKTIAAGVGEIIEANDGKIAWSDNPIQGFQEKSGEELLQRQLLNDFYRDIKMDKLYPKIEVKGVEKVGDKETYVVVATPKDLPAETFYFDQKTGLLVRHDTISISPEGKSKSQTTYEDYRVVDGVQIAHKTKVKTPTVEVITNITEIKHGVKVDDKLFTKPN
jgi:outer membrane lipoprotein-sorting protein